jgi:transposase-like protein
MQPSTLLRRRTAFDELADTRERRYPAIVRLWDNAWNEFIPFLDYDIEIREVLCSTNAIESLNACYPPGRARPSRRNSSPRPTDRRVDTDRRTRAHR